MMTETFVFLSQFVTVWLLGFQSLNVRDGKYLWAAVTSFLLGITGFYTISQISIAKEMFTSIWFAYILAGPIAITSSMWCHKKVFKY